MPSPRRRQAPWPRVRHRHGRSPSLQPSLCTQSPMSSATTCSMYAAARRPSLTWSASSSPAAAASQSRRVSVRVVSRAARVHERLGQPHVSRQRRAGVLAIRPPAFLVDRRPSRSQAGPATLRDSPDAPRTCLTPPARALLERIEEKFGRVKLVSTCRPGATIAGTGRPSRHASGNAIDFDAGSRKARDRRMADRQPPRGRHHDLRRHGPYPRRYRPLFRVNRGRATLGKLAQPRGQFSCPDAADRPRRLSMGWSRPALPAACDRAARAPKELSQLQCLS